MKRSELRKAIKDNGFNLEREGNEWNLWFNSPTGSKEWICDNLEEVEEALKEAIDMKLRGS